MTKYFNAKRAMDLYSQGLRDEAIADQIRSSLWKVQNWRKINDLPTNPIPNGKMVYLDKYRIAQGYKQGLTDTEIAEACGICRVSVWRWRKANNLPANPGSREEWSS
jgi:hypothetical protein